MRSQNDEFGEGMLGGKHSAGKGGVSMSTHSMCLCAFVRIKQK